jgi:hypothetical protein
MGRSAVRGTVAESIRLAGALADDRPSVQWWVFRGGPRNRPATLVTLVHKVECYVESRDRTKAAVSSRAFALPNSPNLLRFVPVSPRKRIR